MAYSTWNLSVEGNYGSTTSWLNSEGKEKKPNATEDAVFGSGHVGNVKYNTSSEARSLIMTGYTGTFKFGPNELKLGEKGAGGYTENTNVIFKAGSGTTYTELGRLVFAPPSAAPTQKIFTLKREFPEISFEFRNEGTTQLEEELKCARIVFGTSSNFKGNGQTIVAKGFESAESVGTLDFTNCTIKISPTISTPWLIGAVEAKGTYIFTGSLIEINTTASSVVFTGGGKTYNEVAFLGAEGTLVGGNNTFKVLKINTSGAASGKGLQLKEGATQTVESITANGTSSGTRCRLETNGAGKKAKIKISKNIEITGWLSIRDIEVEGGILYIPNGVDGETGEAINKSNVNVAFEKLPETKAETKTFSLTASAKPARKTEAGKNYSTAQKATFSQIIKAPEKIYSTSQGVLVSESSLKKLTKFLTTTQIAAPKREIKLAKSINATQITNPVQNTSAGRQRTLAVAQATSLNTNKQAAKSFSTIQKATPTSSVRQALNKTYETIQKVSVVASGKLGLNRIFSVTQAAIPTLSLGSVRKLLITLGLTASAEPQTAKALRKSLNTEQVVSVSGAKGIGKIGAAIQTVKASVAAIVLSGNSQHYNKNLEVIQKVSISKTTSIFRNPIITLLGKVISYKTKIETEKLQDYYGVMTEDAEENRKLTFEKKEAPVRPQSGGGTTDDPQWN